MDTAQEVNDDCTRRGALGTALAHQAVCQQDAKARARVCFQQEENGLACFLHLLDAHRGENTVINGVVQEQHLGRFHKNRSHRQKPIINQQAYTGSHGIGQGCNNRADGFHGNQCQHGCQNAQGEVVHQHLKARLDMAVHGLVKLLDNPGRQRAYNHGAQEHRHLCTDNYAHGGCGTDDAAPLACYHLAACVGNQKRQHHRSHRPHQRSELFIWQPAGRDKHGCNQAPGNKCPDIRHYHAAQKSSEDLQFFFHNPHLVISQNSLLILF